MLPCELSDRVIQRADASDDIACISGGDIAVFDLCHVRFPLPTRPPARDHL